MAAQLERYLRKRWRGLRLLLIVALFVVFFVAVTLVSPEQPASLSLTASQSHARHLLEFTTQDNLYDNVTSTAEPASSGEYPSDLFTEAQLAKGAITLHIIGVIYMFLALAIVCDEFFVPSLEVIIVRLDISEDVAGATFMAAGGSAPELFTSFIGVFVARSNVGIGTIVGSAVFNILFVIGMCACCSKDVLELTWWPLFRDVSFYSVSLICLISFFSDELITWWEALILLSCYLLYVIFMKFNQTIENFVKSKIQRNQVMSVRAGLSVSARGRRASSIPVLKTGGGKFRHGVLQLMIHTIDPLGEAKVHDKAMKLHAIASLGVSGTDNQGCTTTTPSHQTGGGNGTLTSSHNGSLQAISNGQLPANGADNGYSPSQQTTVTQLSNGDDLQAENDRTPENRDDKSGPYWDLHASNTNNNADEVVATQGEVDLDEDVSEPLDMSWPDTWRKRVTYVLLAPIIVPLWLVLPDVRRIDRRKYFPVTFVGSIISIALFSYLMNWWASTAGRTIGIPESVMGMTFLAAGTSIPDLITSVIVAKKGFGDMAVSSSVGSNIFDVTVGLPLPWLIYTLIYSKTYGVNSDGLLCSIVLLFIMLMTVIIMIAAFRWKMNRTMGLSMLALYAVFLLFSLLLLFNIIVCPEFKV